MEMKVHISPINEFTTWVNSNLYLLQLKSNVSNCWNCEIKSFLSHWTFGLFKETLQFFTRNYCENCPSSIQCWDLNPWPLEHEYQPITTRPVFRIDQSWMQWNSKVGKPIPYIQKCLRKKAQRLPLIIPGQKNRLREKEKLFDRLREKCDRTDNLVF